MPRRSRPKLGLTECLGSLSRVGPARQRPGTFRRLDDGVEYWWTHCDRCDTFQQVYGTKTDGHYMVRHSTEGKAYDGHVHLARRTTPASADTAHAYHQDALDLDDTEEETPPF